MKHKLLLVAATVEEISGLLPQSLHEQARAGFVLEGTVGSGNFSVLVTGPGIPATMYRLTQALHERNFDLVINAGIAGSFQENLPIGSVVNVVSDCFPELGADHPDRFIPLYRMAMAAPFLQDFMDEESVIQHYDPYHFESVRLLPRVKGITVQTISGKEDRMRDLVWRTKAEVESMEGAAVFYVCRAINIPCLQIRSVSNYIHPDHLSNWDLPLSIHALEKTLNSLLNEC